MLYDPKWKDTVVVKAPKAKWRALLLQAADIVRTRGLAKDTQEDEEGRVCIHGAISIARFGHPFHDEDGHACKASRAVARYLNARGVPQELASNDGCADWNNEPDRTVDEVIEALDGAARS